MLLQFFFAIVKDFKHPGYIWADNLGKAVGYSIQALILSIIVQSFITGFPRKMSDIRLFCDKLGLKLLFISLLMFFYVSFMEKNYHDKLIERERIRTNIEITTILETKASPVIASAKKKLENAVKADLMKYSSDAIGVNGWSATNVSDDLWLVKFEFEVNGTSRWKLWQYNQYLDSFVNILGDKKLEEKYINRADDGTSLKSEIEYKTSGHWYGPIK